MQENRLATATKELNEAQAKLDDKQRELDKVQAIYDAAMAEKQVCIPSHEIYFKFLYCEKQGQDENFSTW